MKYEFAHADTCLPCYWSGHHLPHVQIAIPHGGMFLKDLKQAIRDELRMGAVAGSDDTARLLSDNFVGAENEKQADRITRAAYAAVNRITLVNGKRKVFTDIKYENEHDESVYAFFILTEI